LGVCSPYRDKKVVGVFVRFHCAAWATARGDGECVFSFFFFMLLEQEAHKQDDRQSFERFIVGVLTRNQWAALAPYHATASVVETTVGQL
jgi:hypothetical protein